jgi:hypothetical protein
MCALGSHAARLGTRKGLPPCTAQLRSISSSLQVLRRACGLSTWLPSGRRLRSLAAFALPAYKLARKSEDEMAGMVDEPSDDSVTGPRFPYKVGPASGSNQGHLGGGMPWAPRRDALPTYARLMLFAAPALLVPPLFGARRRGW